MVKAAKNGKNSRKQGGKKTRITLKVSIAFWLYGLSQALLCVFSFIRIFASFISVFGFLIANRVAATAQIQGKGDTAASHWVDRDRYLRAGTSRGRRSWSSKDRRVI